MDRTHWIGYYRGQAAHYHDRVEECLTLADNARTPEGCRGYTSLAECWMRLAHSAEGHLLKLEAKPGIEPGYDGLQPSA